MFNGGVSKPKTKEGSHCKVLVKIEKPKACLWCVFELCALYLCVTKIDRGSVIKT